MYLRTDEEAEATEALAMASRMAARAAHDTQAWRWFVIALHNATQGFMVLSLRHGNGLLALTDECYAAWMDAYENNKPYPPEKLDSYLCLYKKVKHKELGTIGGNIRFVPKTSQGRSIRKLNSLRNEFIHFTPKSWSLELSDLPRIGLDCAALISFLGWETQNIFWHHPDLKEQSQESHAQMLTELAAIEESYARAANELRR